MYITVFLSRAWFHLDRLKRRRHGVAHSQERRKYVWNDEEMISAAIPTALCLTLRRDFHVLVLITPYSFVMVESHKSKRLTGRDKVCFGMLENGGDLK
jgi:hypothetical protein